MSHLSSVDVLHYKAQPILRLERVLQRLKHETNTLSNTFIFSEQKRSFLLRIYQKNLWDEAASLYWYLFIPAHMSQQHRCVIYTLIYSRLGMDAECFLIPYFLWVCERLHPVMKEEERRNVSLVLVSVQRFRMFLADVGKKLMFLNINTSDKHWR